MIISTNCVSLVSAVTTVPTSAPSRRTVTRSVISRTSSRSCETKRIDAPAAAASRTSENSRSIALPRQEHRRLVEHEHAVAAPDAAVLLDRAHDREQRALDRLQVGRRRARGSSRSAVALERLARPGALAPPRDAEARARRRDVGDAQVLEHAQRLDEPEVLVDEAEAELAELPGRERQPHLLAVDPELAGVGRVEAGEDLDQRRLARAVLPEEAVDLPGEQTSDRRRAAPASRRSSS